MRSDTGRTDSLWMATVPPRVLPPLAEDQRADVAVIGAGIAGITTAYLLALEGRRVVVLEDGAVGGGETGRTTAHLSNALDDRYHVLERLHGQEGARLARGQPRGGDRPDRIHRRRPRRSSATSSGSTGISSSRRASRSTTSMRSSRPRGGPGSADVAHGAPRARRLLRQRSLPPLSAPGAVPSARSTWTRWSGRSSGAVDGSSATPTSPVWRRGRPPW